MKKIVLASALCASMLFASNSQYKYEITPMLGGAYTEGNLNLDRNYANLGLSLGFNLEDSMFDQIELGILQSLGDVDYKNSNQDTAITRIFSNVIKEYPLGGNSSLYALVGAGVEHFTNEQFKNETGLFGNYGVGYKYTFDNDMALKFDLRHLIETDHGDNNLLYTIGLAIPFGQKAAPVKASEPVEETPATPVVQDVDTDGDGVVDRLDQCPNSEANAIVDEAGCVIAVNLKVLFDFDKATIKEAYTAKLSRFAEVLQTYPSVKTKLSAHTDSLGTEEYNLKLSQDRADAVKKALVKLGIDETRITTKGYGETKPVGNNATAEGRAQNRRVEATVSK
ncbi:MAG: OmpA family protein [Deltaproteobacteria bacterium HGW-Deltaproteobacteria-24]|jgi:OOP family OmpA-OmpF porin|nr:MAG: OmpA family protein [Deltaproteobacteria bacterium HGW-Deltaproteobacteria-24]